MLATSTGGSVTKFDSWIFLNVFFWPKFVQNYFLSHSLTFEMKTVPFIKKKKNAPTLIGAILPFQIAQTESSSFPSKWGFAPRAHWRSWNRMPTSWCLTPQTVFVLASLLECLLISFGGNAGIKNLTFCGISQLLGPEASIIRKGCIACFGVCVLQDRSGFLFRTYQVWIQDNLLLYSSSSWFILP